MPLDSVKSYLSSPVKTPFFLFIGDEQYAAAVDELIMLDMHFVPMSGFCSGDDKMPDVDRLFGHIEEADMNASGKKFVVTGLGEFLALQGAHEARRALSRLKDLNIGGAKVVLLLRGLASLVIGLEADPRFDSRRHSVVGNTECKLSFTIASPAVGMPAISGFKALLAKLESGYYGRVVANTAINFEKAMFNVQPIDNAYEGITRFASGFALPRSCGNDEYWADLLADLNRNGGSLDAVFEHRGFGGNLESDFYARIAGSEYRNWLYFVCLKSKADTLQNSYLRFVLDTTNCFEDFKGNVLNAIIEISHTDKRFSGFYQERRALVEKFPEPDIASFVVNNRQVLSESIYKLTDATEVERKEIVAWLSKNGMVPKLDTIYPALAAYMQKYIFKCSELADMLTEYFEAYKRQKLSNQLEPEFLEKVDELARLRQFNRLPTREAILDKVDKTETYLYWLDALGADYLGLIEALVQKKGLSMRVNIARAELPTITSINRNFFDAWQGAKNGANGDKRLDEVKHEEQGGYDFTSNDLPIHLAKELDIITEVIDRAATQLALREYKRFLIVSDHGASRLAVLCRKEEKYDTDTFGEHSGRCCKLFQPYDLPFAAEENGYLVLADYGRFKGSRAANVEVHGGASLEEVVIPIIELSLKDDNLIVKLVDEMVTVDFHTGAEIKLFFNALVRDVSVVIYDKPYLAVQTDENHYSVKLPDMKRAGSYPADVYAGDDLIGSITVKAQGKSGKVNDAFDDLF